jgi:hypothetical protein
VSSNEHLYRFTAALGAAAVGIAFSSTLALATGGGEGGEHGGESGGEAGGFGFGDTAQIEVTGYIAPTCEFTTLPDQTSFGQMVTDQEEDLGDLGFTCNIATSSAVNLTVKSLNGALKRVGGSETVPYQIKWEIQGPGAYATIPTSPFGFNLLSGTSGVQELGAYKLKVTGATVGGVAGQYKDLITYTISP